MGEAARIWTTVGANIAPLKAGLAEAGAATNSFGSTFSRSMTARTAEMERFGRSWSRYVSLPIIAGAAVATKMAIDFQRNMALISTSAGASARDVQILSGQILKLAASGASPYGPNELAKALYHLKSLGYDNATAMNALRVSIAGAMAGQSDLESTTSALGAALRTNIKGTGDFRQAMAVLNATVGAGNMRMSDLIGALGTGVLPAAKLAGLSLKDVGAALALMVDEGMQADAAATRLRMGFTLMATGSTSAEKALERVGLTHQKLAITMQRGGLIPGLALLKSHLEQLGGSNDLARWAKSVDQGKMSLTQFQQLASKTAQFDVLSHAFGGARSAAAIELMINNFGVLQQKVAQINRTTGQFNDKVKQAQQLDMTKLRESWAEIDANLIKIGSEIAPFVVKTVRGIADLTGEFVKLNHETHGGFAIFAGALAVGGPALLFSAKMITALRTIRDLFGVEAAAATVATGTVAGDLEAQGAAARTAQGEVAGLRGSLLGLGALSLAPIIIPIELKVLGKERSAVGSLFGRAGKTAFDALGLVAAGGITGTNLFTDVFGGGGKKTAANTSGMSNDPVHDAAGRSGGGVGSGAGSGAGGPTPPPTYSKSFTLPYSLRVAEANAGLSRSTADDVANAKRIVATIEALKHAGRLKGQALLDALADESTALQTIWSAQTATSKAATKKAKALQNFALPLFMQVAQARADAMASLVPNASGPTAAQLTLANEVKAKALSAINSHKLTMQALLDAWGIVGQANGVIAQGGANGLSQHFALSTAMQLRQAKADAIAALNPDLQGPSSAQVTLAKAAKAAAMHAINSHKLTMQGLIDAWNIVAQANQTLAQAGGQADSYVAVSTKALTEGLGLSRDQAKSIRERAAQAAAHGGSRPVGTAADGISIGELHLHGVQDINALWAELDKVSRRRSSQRAGQR